MLSDRCPFQHRGLEAFEKPGILDELVRSLVWLVLLALVAFLAHGCLNPQPTAPARDESESPGMTATSNAANGASASSTSGNPSAGTGGGIEDGSGGTAAEPSPGSGGAAGETGLDQGGASPDGE